MKKKIMILPVFCCVLLSGCMSQIHHPTKYKTEWFADHDACEKKVRKLIRQDPHPQGYDKMDEMKLIENCMKEKGWQRKLSLPWKF